MTPQERAELKDAIARLAEAIAEVDLPPAPPRPEPKKPIPGAWSAEWGKEDIDEFLKDVPEKKLRRHRALMQNHPVKLLLELQSEGRIPKEVFADDRRYFALLDKLGM